MQSVLDIVDPECRYKTLLASAQVNPFEFKVPKRKQIGSWSTSNRHTMEPFAKSCRPSWFKTASAPRLTTKFLPCLVVWAPSAKANWLARQEKMQKKEKDLSSIIMLQTYTWMQESVGAGDAFSEASLIDVKLLWEVDFHSKLLAFWPWTNCKQLRPINVWWSLVIPIEKIPQHPPIQFADFTMTYKQSREPLWTCSYVMSDFCARKCPLWGELVYS